MDYKKHLKNLTDSDLKELRFKANKKGELYKAVMYEIKLRFDIGYKN